MAFSSLLSSLRAGKTPEFPPNANTSKYARHLDSQDQLSHLRDQFIIPTKGSLRKAGLNGSIPTANGSDTQTISTNGCSKGINGVNGIAGVNTRDDDSPCIYFCGNSLGAQPKSVREYVDAQLETWASIGVNGHFRDLGGSPLVAWQDMAESCAEKSAHIVGASPGEIVIMNTLTANLHLLMATFYLPDEKRHKIILEWKPFPSDYYAIESQIRFRGLDPGSSMVCIAPEDGAFVIPTSQVLATIDAHADTTAMILLPAIQYYTGQLFNIPLITSYARARGIVVGWDLAHAAGNVPLRLHDWDVDFAVWCTYKYLNAGPGAIAGAFVHERHGLVSYLGGSEGMGVPVFRPRLAGWYGGDKRWRFEMANEFRPSAGAAGWQLSNPSAVDLACLSAALGVFGTTSMEALRAKSLVLTAYAEWLLGEMLADAAVGDEPPFRIITPRQPLERGAQLSLLLRPGLLEKVGKELEAGGVVCDQRKPDVIRIAPLPMYCRFSDVWEFMDIFARAIGLRHV